MQMNSHVRAVGLLADDDTGDTKSIHRDIGTIPALRSLTT